MSELSKEELENIKKFAKSVAENLEIAAQKELVETQQKAVITLMYKKKLKELYDSKLFEKFIKANGEDRIKIGMQIDIELDYPFSIGEGFVQNITGAFNRDAESIDEGFSSSNYIINSYAEMMAEAQIKFQNMINSTPPEHKF